MTLGCARCHNHKFDPLTARDYYSMAAIFNGLKRPQRGRTELTLPVAAWPEIDREKERDARIATEVARAAVQFKIIGGYDPAITRQIEQWKHDQPDLPRGYFLHEPSAQPAAMHLLVRGKATRPGPEVEPAVPAVLVREPFWRSAAVHRRRGRAAAENASELRRRIDELAQWGRRVVRLAI